MQASHAAETPSRLQRLLAFLEREPGNLALLNDAATAALNERRPELAAELIQRYEAIAPAPPALRNIKGLAALGQGDFQQAAELFQELQESAPTEVALRFNLGWARYMLGDAQGALDVVDSETAAAVPNAAALRIHALHQLGLIEEALVCGRELAKRLPDDRDLMGALANVAVDAEDLELAREYATKAGDQHEGLSALGMVLLADGETPGAIAIFEHALEKSPDDARAALGLGFSLMVEQRPSEASKWLDKGAEEFGDHAGSWLASGWAHFGAGDLDNARDRLTKALACDPQLGEAHAALALLDLLENQLAGARRHLEAAAQLDDEDPVVSLAQSVLLAAEGDPAAAQNIRDFVLRTPISSNGKILADAIAAAVRARTSKSDN